MANFPKSPSKRPRLIEKIIPIIPNFKALSTALPRDIITSSFHFSKNAHRWIRTTDSVTELTLPQNSPGLSYRSKKWLLH